MNYNIELIQKDTPIKGVFFFDTNIWINVIAPKFSDSADSFKYASFFDKVFSSPSARIAMSSVLVSEIINLYIRRIAFKLYQDENHGKIPHSDFKSRYRPTEHYLNHYKIVCDEIDQRKDKFDYLPDPLQTMGLNEALAQKRLDFNDFVFHKLCQDHPVIFVTDDSDFFLPDIRILTLNHKLYKRKFE